MNYGMPGTNNHCYTEATGQPAKRNCSSGWTKQQRAPVNSSQLRPTTASFAQYCYSRSFGERKRFLNSRAFHNGAARFADSQIGTTPTIFTLDPFTPTRFIRYFALFPIAAAAGPRFSLSLPKWSPDLCSVAKVSTQLVFSYLDFLRSRDSPESERRRDMD